MAANPAHNQIVCAQPLAEHDGFRVRVLEDFVEQRHEFVRLDAEIVFTDIRMSLFYTCSGTTHGAR
ncbi:MAG TPA: hypothetical protein PK967_02620 [Candidatus Hydrogenedentes bacterium]|nr:hypothetical protein [Candidatus Hydrogenedentota bacterium]